MRPIALLLCIALAAPAAAQLPCQARDPVTAEINAREGIRLAKAGQFADAEALFRTAVRLDACMSKYPWLLGRALERQEKFDEAELTYKAVMSGHPTSVEFTKAQGALAELQAKRARMAAEKREAEAQAKALAARKAQEDARRQAEAARKAAEAEEARRQAELAAAELEARRQAESQITVGPWGTLGWLSVGVGALAIGAGVGFAVAAQDADDELKLAATRPDRDRYDELVDERETFSTLSWVGYGIGGALAVGGLAMVLVGDAQTSGTISPTPGGVAVGLSGRF